MCGARENAALQRSVETLRRDLSEMRARLDDVRLSRQETLKQLMELRAQHENQLTSIQLDLRDETSSRQVRRSCRDLDLDFSTSV